MLCQGYQGLRTEESLNLGETCTKSGMTAIFNVTNFTVDPLPKKNTFVRFTMTGVSAKNETVPELDAAFKVDGIAYYKEKFPLNAKFEVNDVAGVSVQIYVPGSAENGSYAAQLKLRNDAGDELCCWEYDFTL